MLCNSIWAALLLFSLVSDAQADVLDRAHIADVAASERLHAFTYGKLLETGQASRSEFVMMKRNLISQGFYYEPGASRVIASESWIAPVLSFDGNINGGVRQNSFIVNSYVFDVDPSYRAKAGVVMGLLAGGLGRIAWASGRYFEGRLQGELVWSPKYQIARKKVKFSVCSNNHITAWTFFDICYYSTLDDRTLNSSSSQETAIAMTQLLHAGAGYHEISTKISYSQYKIGRQPSVTLSWDAVWDRASTKLSLTKAVPINGEIALDSRVVADVQWLWKTHTLGAELWYQRTTGGAFLGMVHTDKAMGISFSYQLSSNLTVQIGYEENEPSVGFFDYSQTSVSMRLDALRW